MIGSLLALLAASALDLGTSPLAEPGHAHRWTEVQNDREGISWVDEAWHSQTVIDGRKLQLVLMRADITVGDPMSVDFILAVDCERDLLGMKDGWVHQSSVGDNFKIPDEELTMDFAQTPPSREDRKLLDFACKAGSGRR